MSCSGVDSHKIWQLQMREITALPFTCKAEVICPISKRYNSMSSQQLKKYALETAARETQPEQTPP